MRRDPKIREILPIFSSLFHLETLRPWLPVEQSASLWPLAQQGYRERRRRRSGCIIFCCWFLDEARVSDAFEIKRLVGCTVSGARTPSWTGGGGGGKERRGERRGGMDVPFGYDRNENRKRGETTKYSLNSFHERR